MTTPVSPPSITSITFDKPNGYNTGDTITATINYVAGVSSSTSTQTFTGTATDSVSGQSGQIQFTFTTANNATDSESMAVSDTGNRAWTKVSDNGSVAVFTATA